MKEELEKFLVEKYPMLYEQYHWTSRQTCMCWGFEVPDEWFELISDLSRQISEVSPETRATQVKIKFGGLRYYVENTAKENEKAVLELIHNAEKIARNTPWDQT